MKDIFNKEINLDDIVAFNPPNYKGLVRGRVIKFTPKMVRVKYKDHCGNIDETVVYPTDCCVYVEETA